MSRRKPHRDSFVTFIREHVHVTPPTQLLQEPLSGGPPRVIAEFPERRDTYALGQVVAMGTVNAARSFAKAMAGACVVGRIANVAEYNAGRAAGLAEIAAKGAP
jgi:hypothetical protein